MWQGMESRNSEFFRAYDVRLRIKEQITAFNYLVSQQAQVTENAKSSPTASAASFSSAVTSPFIRNTSEAGSYTFACVLPSCLCPH